MSEHTWERRIVDAILTARVLVLAIVLGITAVAGVFAGRVEFDSDIEIWFLEGDENLATYRDFLKRFDADELTVLGVFADDVFAPEVLQAVKKITDATMKEVPHAWRVRSLTNTDIVRRRGPGHVAVEPLVEDLPEDAEGYAELRKEALANPLLVGNLVSADGKATGLVVELDARDNNFTAKVAFIEGIRRLAVLHLPGSAEFHIAGSPPLDEAFYKYTERDFTILGPAAGLVVVFATLLLFRRWSAAVVPLSVVALANIWLFGLMGFLGLKINLVSSGLVALVLAVGVADSVHVLSDYYQALMKGMERDEAVAHATASLLVPCLFTSATTAAGFLALLTSDLAPISEFGWLAAVGVAIAFILSMTFIPCVLRYAKAPDPKFIERQRTGRVSRLLVWLGRPTPRRARITLAASVGLLLLAGYGLTKLDTEANPMNYFLPGDPVRESMTRVDQELGGASSFEFLVTTPDGGLKDPQTLVRLEAFANRVETLPGVARVLSVLDTLKETRKALTDGEQAGIPTPADHPHLAAQLYLFLEGADDFRTMVQGDYSVARLTARVRLSEANKLQREVHRVDAWIEELNDPTLTIVPTGFVKLMSDMEGYLFRSQISSLGLAIVIITGMMFLLLRSVRLGLFSMIPNLVPIALGLAFMALLGYALDPGTVMIGSIALGLVVDDTVHYLVRLKRNLGGGSLEDAIDRSMAQTGRPIIVTSLILAGGFATMGLGSFTPNVAFGLVTAGVILFAVVADLVMLPAALLVVRPKV